MSSQQLNLTQAIKMGLLPEFIAQEEARGVGPIAEADFDDLAAAVIRTSQSDGQTSGSLPAGGSRGK